MSAAAEPAGPPSAPKQADKRIRAGTRQVLRKVLCLVLAMDISVDLQQERQPVGHAYRREGVRQEGEAGRAGGALELHKAKNAGSPKQAVSCCYCKHTFYLAAAAKESKPNPCTNTPMACLLEPAVALERR
jgi:hypothetical protein